MGHCRSSPARCSRPSGCWRAADGRHPAPVPPGCSVEPAKIVIMEISVIYGAIKPYPSTLIMQAEGIKWLTQHPHAPDVGT